MMPRFDGALLLPSFVRHYYHLSCVLTVHCRPPGSARELEKAKCLATILLMQASILALPASAPSAVADVLAMPSIRALVNALSVANLVSLGILTARPSWFGPSGGEVAKVKDWREISKSAVG